MRYVVSRVTKFDHYSVLFEERSDDQYCSVRTVEGISLFNLCVNVQLLGQRVPHAQLSSLSLSRIVISLPAALVPICIRGLSSLVLRVLSDERTDGLRFILAREISSDLFLHLYRVAHQEIFGMLEVTTMIDFLMLRLPGVLQEPWKQDVTELVVTAHLVYVWDTVRDKVYFRYTGPRHIKSSFDKVGCIRFGPSFFFVFCDSP